MLAAMTLSKRLRRWVSGAMTVAVLFTQLAIAAYVCPAPESNAQAPVAMEAMPDCHGMGEPDPAAPQLCKAHCSQDAQSSARTLLPDLQPNPASVALLVRVIEPQPPVSGFAVSGRAPPLSNTADPIPIYLALLVLRN